MTTLIILNGSLMNKDWLDYIKTQGAKPIQTDTGLTLDFPDSDICNGCNVDKTCLYAVTHLDIIEAKGIDAATFLQGQLTCDINDISSSQSRFAAFCNPKGRVISPILVLRATGQDNAFYLLVPKTLTENVIQRLSMYILRADVSLTLRSDTYCLTGLSLPEPSTLSIPLPEKHFETSHHNTLSVIRLPNHKPRYLIIGNTEASIDFWNACSNTPNTRASSALWRYLDLSAGLPWFEADQSEQYIPQMLNIDKLGGISFNKGCYTGQEIVARTHYLGKNKREIFLAECHKPASLKAGLAVRDKNKPDLSGKVLTWQALNDKARLLLVISCELSPSDTLVLEAEPSENLTIIPFE